jgi:hemerythrin-like domain-containing protein
MCEHCGCRGVEPIAELMDEHFLLLDLGAQISLALAAGDRPAAWRSLAELATALGRHVHKEEDGVFRALKEQGDFREAVIDLEAEHLDFDEALSDLGLHDAELESQVESLLEHLSLHIDKENLGIFPVAVVTLGAAGWDTVTRAHQGAVRA